MEGNPYVMSLITQTGVIITAVLGFVTVLIKHVQIRKQNKVMKPC